MVETNKNWGLNIMQCDEATIMRGSKFHTAPTFFKYKFQATTLEWAYPKQLMEINS